MCNPVNKICSISRGLTRNVESDKQSDRLLAHAHSYFMHTLFTLYYFSPLGLATSPCESVLRVCVWATECKFDSSLKIKMHLHSGCRKKKQDFSLKLCKTLLEIGKIKWLNGYLESWRLQQSLTVRIRVQYKKYIYICMFLLECFRRNKFFWTQNLLQVLAEWKLHRIIIEIAT